MLFLDSFFGFFSDFNFVLKIFALIAIIGFLNQNITNNYVKVILGCFMIYFILIANWATLGTIWVIYTILGLGVSGMIVDFFFVSAQSGHGDSEQESALTKQNGPSPAVGQGRNRPAMRR